MTEREEILCAAAEVEIILRKLGVPLVFMIGIPSTGEVVRGCLGMGSEDNRKIFGVHFANLMKDHAEGKLES